MPDEQREVVGRGSAANRYVPLLVVAGASVLVAVVVVLYDRGWLPLAGPFAAVALVAVIQVLVLRSRHRRLRAHAADAARRLRAVEPAIARERELPAVTRPTGASDESLARAADRVELALQRLAVGHDQGAVPFLTDLARTARESWLADAPLTQEVEQLAETTSRLDEAVGRMRAAAERRRR